MAVEDKGGWKGWCHPRKGEKDFPDHIQDNNATIEHRHCPASARYPSPQESFAPFHTVPMPQHCSPDIIV